MQEEGPYMRILLEAPKPGGQRQRSLDQQAPLRADGRMHLAAKGQRERSALRTRICNAHSVRRSSASEISAVLYRTPGIAHDIKTNDGVKSW